jgi:hypothetical protein
MVLICRDDFAAKLRVLTTLFDLDNDQWLNLGELTALVFTLARVLTAVGYFKTGVSEEEAESTVRHCLHDLGVGKPQRPQDGLTLFEAKSWLKALASKSPYLSVLFGIEYQFAELSSFARQVMRVVTPYPKL